MPQITDVPEPDARHRLAEKIGDLLARAWVDQQNSPQAAAVRASAARPVRSPRANSRPFEDYNSYGPSRGEEGGEEDGDDAVGRHTP